MARPSKNFSDEEFIFLPEKGTAPGRWDKEAQRSKIGKVY